MKKNILKVAFVAAIALVSGINVFNSHKTENSSDVVLANVEALASDFEGSGSGTVDCCGDTKLCKGNYCGLFLPANGDKAIRMYFKY